MRLDVSRRPFASNMSTLIVYSSSRSNDDRRAGPVATDPAEQVDESWFAYHRRVLAGIRYFAV